MAAKTTIDTRVSLSAQIKVAGVATTVHIEAASSHDAISQLKGLLGNASHVETQSAPATSTGETGVTAPAEPAAPGNGGAAGASATPSAPDQPSTTAPSQAAATAPTSEPAAAGNGQAAPTAPSAPQTAQPTPSETGAAPQPAATSSAGTTAAPSIDKEAVVAEARKLLQAGKKDTLTQILQKHGAQTISTAPAEKYAEILADIQGELAL